MSKIKEILTNFSNNATIILLNIATLCILSTIAGGIAYLLAPTESRDKFALWTVICICISIICFNKPLRKVGNSLSIKDWTIWVFFCGLLLGVNLIIDMLVSYILNPTRPIEVDVFINPTIIFTIIIVFAAVSGIYGLLRALLIKLFRIKS